MGLVRVLPCVPQNFIFSLYIICICECFILELPVLCIKSPDVATNKYGPEDDATEGDLLNSFAIPIPISRGGSVWFW